MHCSLRNCPLYIYYINNALLQIAADHHYIVYHEQNEELVGRQVPMATKVIISLSKSTDIDHRKVKLS